jgi:hypothetical protein
VIAGNFPDLGAFFVSKFLRLLQVEQRVFVVRDFKFTKAKKSPGRANPGVTGNQVVEGGNRIAIVVGVVVDGAEIPPSFIPFGTQLESQFVVPNGLVDVAGVTSGGSIGGKLVEDRGLVGRGLCRARAENNERKTEDEYRPKCARSDKLSNAPERTDGRKAMQIGDVDAGCRNESCSRVKCLASTGNAPPFYPL